MILKLRKSKNAVKQLPYLSRFVPDQYNTQQMFDKDALKSGGTLKSVPDCYKNQQICDKAIENYPYASEFIPECSKI